MNFTDIFFEVSTSFLNLKNLLNPVFNDAYANKNEFNSLGFRCEEFKKNHDKKHILFSGCSVTYGSHLELNNIWAKKTYDKISKNKKCSGYFNLAIPGSSILDQIYNMFQYFKMYENPDVIFFMIPDYLRFYYLEKDNNLFSKNSYSIYHANVDEKDSELLLFLSIQYYLMLEMYCKSNNIELYSFTWASLRKNKKSLSLNFLNNFNTFYSIDEKKLNNFVFEYIENNKDKKYVEFAMDNKHFGSSYHEYWSNFIYEIYNKKEMSL